MDAHNTFEAPDTVAPVPFSVSAADGILSVELPPKAVLVLAVDE